jgi:crotonobetainyl-CoA:carnitine CoA-transferase CaiB-like acyl-CoA transferase
VNPDLFYLEAPGYGIDGPCSHRPAFAPTIAAGSGLSWRVAGAGVPDDPDLAGDGLAAAARRLRMGSGGTFANCDGMSAMGTATALLLGLAAKDAGAGGQRGLTTMLNTVGHALFDEVVEYDDRAPAPCADEQLHGFGPLYRLYETSDGWGFLAAPQDREWGALVSALRDEEDLGRDARFATAALRAEHATALAEVLAAILATRNAAEWEQRLLGAGVGFVVASTDPPVLIQQDETFGVPSGLVVDVTGPLFDDHPRNAPAVSFSRSTTTPRSGCLLGQHTDALLRELGYDDDAIVSLRDRNVVR